MPKAYKKIGLPVPKSSTAPQSDLFEQEGQEGE